MLFAAAYLLLVVVVRLDLLQQVGAVNQVFVGPYHFFRSVQLSPYHVEGLLRHSTRRLDVFFVKVL